MRWCYCFRLYMLLLLFSFYQQKKTDIKGFEKVFLFSCQYLVWNLVREKWLLGNQICGKAANRKNKIGENWLSFSQVVIFLLDSWLNFNPILFNPDFFFPESYLKNWRAIHLHIKYLGWGYVSSIYKKEPRTNFLFISIIFLLETKKLTA